MFLADELHVMDYSLLVGVYAVSTHFGGPDFRDVKWQVWSNQTITPRDLAVKLSCQFTSREKKAQTVFNECAALAALNVYCLGVLSVFTFLSFLALRQFARDLEATG